jgi:hypothetical protein
VLNPFNPELNLLNLLLQTNQSLPEPLDQLSIYASAQTPDPSREKYGKIGGTTRFWIFAEPLNTHFSCWSLVNPGFGGN